MQVTRKGESRESEGQRRAGKTAKVIENAGFSFLSVALGWPSKDEIGTMK
jgi:hypothetical protein